MRLSQQPSRWDARSAATKNTTHWHRNDGKDNVMLIAIDVFQSKPERPMPQAEVVRSQERDAFSRPVLWGWLASICLISLYALLVGRPERQRTLEATAQMEQLVRQLHHARAIAPDTVSTITDIIARPAYDCARLKCDPALAQRNRSVRKELKSLLAVNSVKTAPDRMSGKSNRRR